MPAPLESIAAYRLSAFFVSLANVVNFCATHGSSWLAKH